LVKPVSETCRQADTLSTTTLSLVNQLYFPNIISKQLPFSIYLPTTEKSTNQYHSWIFTSEVFRQTARHSGYLLLDYNTEFYKSISFAKRS